MYAEDGWTNLMVSADGTITKEVWTCRPLYTVYVDKVSKSPATQNLEE